MNNELVTSSAQSPIQIGNQGAMLGTINEMFAFAQMVIKAGMAPKGYESPEKVLIALEMGRELGLAPMQALQSVAIINGRPGLYGDGLLGVVQSSPVCEYIQERSEGSGDDLTAICEVKRRGSPSHTVTFSVREAKAAQLWGKAGPWTNYPKRMLMWRARGWACRDQFADVLKGFKPAEELEDYEETGMPSDKPRTMKPQTRAPQAVVVVEAQTAPDPAPEATPVVPQAPEKMSVAQGKRLFAIAKSNGYAKDDINAHIKALHSLDHISDITTDIYDAVCAHFSEAPDGSTAEPEREREAGEEG